jgi:UDP-N-acetyl-D-mannosaminouronate:lipid I N-acetyl-D-mannosaminouronosyltransferase
VKSDDQSETAVELPVRVEQGHQVARIAGLDVIGFASVESCAMYILARAQRDCGGAAFAVNAEKVISYREDAIARELLSRGTLRYPDGAGVVLAMRRHGVKTVRVPGADLWLSVLQRSAPAGIDIALIGARPDVLVETRCKIAREMPHIRVVFAADGFQGASDFEFLVNSITQSKPHLVLVAMGSPRQEKLIVDLMKHCPGGYYMGLGGSFDVYCGRKRRAPLWMQRNGLEWLFRFVSEPSRFFREMKRIRFLGLLLSGRV